MDNKEVDLYRDTLLRYCGYANEVGESFRPIIPKRLVHASYGIAITYVIADCMDKSLKVYKKPSLTGENTLLPAMKVAGDVFLWQMFASVIIPGIVINRVTWFAGLACKKSKLPMVAKKWLPTCIGLAVIPFIIHPIDTAIDHGMDRTYRKYV